MSKKIVLMLCMALLLYSCSSIQYSSDGKIPLALGNKTDYRIPREVVGKKKFYLWGLYPQKHVVKIDQELMAVTIPAGAKVSVEEYQTWSDFIYMVLTFGMYMPVSYKITCLTIDDEK